MSSDTWKTNFKASRGTPWIRSRVICARAARSTPTRTTTTTTRSVSPAPGSATSMGDSKRSIGGPVVGEGVDQSNQRVACVMLQQRSCSSKATLLVSPHSCAFPRAVGAYVRPQPSGPFKDLRRLAHVFVDGLARPVTRPVRPTLPDPDLARLGKHPFPQLSGQVNPMALARL